MTFKSGLAGLAFAGTAFLWGSTALSQPIAVPVAAAPASPQPVDPEAGLEAREAAAPAAASVADPIPGTLNAQYALLQANPAAATPEPEPPAPAAIPTTPVGVEPLPPVGVRLAAIAPAPIPTAVVAPAVIAVAEPLAPAPLSPPPGDGPPSSPFAAAAPPPVPSVALSRRVVESAQAFVAYMQRASAVKPRWVDAPGVAHALELGGIYEQGELEEGEVAYAALVALQDPRFVASVREAAVDPMRREAIGRALLADPGAVLQTPGARSAAIHAASALGRLGYGLHLTGEAVKHSAYDMQHSAWSLTNVAESQAALLQLKARSAVREPLGEDGGRTLIASLSDPAAADAPGEVHRVTPVVARGLTLAALALLGEAGEDRGATLLPILADAANAQCVKMARLNLYQCLSVAGPQYEDVFCLGQHAMMETAQCVETASGWTPAPEVPAAPVVVAAAPAPAPAASIYVPVAMTTSAAAPALGAPSPTYALAAASMGPQR